MYNNKFSEDELYIVHHIFFFLLEKLPGSSYVATKYVARSDGRLWVARGKKLISYGAILIIFMHNSTLVTLYSTNIMKHTYSAV